LAPQSVPVSATDKLVTVTVSVTPVPVAKNDSQSLLASIMDFLVSSANAALNPTLSVQATAKIINGAVVNVNPIFSTQVPDPSVTPTTGNPNPLKTVPVVCDIASIPTTVQISSVWALNKAAGDMLVNMKYPTSVQATYDPATGKFSACTFAYSSGNFIVYGDQTVGDTVDPLVGGVTQTGTCANYSGIYSIIANGDPSRNTSGTPIVTDLFDSSYFDGSTSTWVPGPICGSARTITYGKGIATQIKKVNFNNTTLTNTGSFTADSNYIYAVGSDPGYGGYAIKISCPVTVVKISDGSTACVSIPSITNYVNYPQLNQVGSTLNLKKPYPSLFTNSNGNIILSLQTFNQLCSVSSCGNVGAAAPPILYSIVPANLAVSALSPNTANYPSTVFMTPVGASNGYLTLAGIGGGPINGELWNMNTDQLLHTCLIDPTFGAGCTNSHWVFGDYVYGMRQCAYNSSTPNICLGTPSIGRTNTKTGVVQQWDPVALGWLPQQSALTAQGFQYTPVLWFSDQVTFLACSAPTSTCSNPSWVTLDFATGSITPADPSLTSGVAMTLVQASF